MSASVSAFLAQVRASGAELPSAVAAALLLAAVRISDQKSRALQPDLLMVDEQGELDLKFGDSGGSDSWMAPELKNGAVLPDDQRALVYAAGALGYELCTLRPPEPGASLDGALGAVIAKALSPERGERWRTLEEMAHALEKVQARPSEDEERLILSAVVQTQAPTPLGRIELSKAPAPYRPEAWRDEMKANPPAPPPHPIFAQSRDPLETSGEDLFGKPARRAEPALEELEVEGIPEPNASSEELLALLEAERKERQEDLLVLESRVENLARLGGRISGLEQKLSAPPPPALPAKQNRLPLAGLIAAASLAGLTVGGLGMFALTRKAAPAPIRAAPNATTNTNPTPSQPQAAAPDPTPSPARTQAAAPDPTPSPARTQTAAPDPVADPTPQKVARADRPRPRRSTNRTAAAAESTKGDKSLRSFDTASALAAFESAVSLDPSFPAAHRGLGMVYVLQGRNAEARVEYRKYLELDPNAADRDRIERLLSH